jgi:hypothetical protein
MLTHQFITERNHLKGVSPATIQWYRSSFKAFEGALGSKQAVIGVWPTAQDQFGVIDQHLSPPTPS